MNKITVVAVLCLSFAGVSMAGERKATNIPAQELALALQAFAKERNLQVVCSAELLKGISTRGVSGELTSNEALSKLLSGTGLTYRYIDENTVTVVLANVSSASGNHGAAEIAGQLNLAQTETDPRKERQASGKPAQNSESAATSTGDVSGEMQVTGSRIRSLVGEQSIQPVLTITSKDIERLGVSSLGELLRHIPQVSSYSVGQALQVPTSSGGASLALGSNRVSATLRGAPADGTLLLVDGRRVPKTGQETSQDGYDLSGIPLGSIERIEVLLDGGSAVYGADAMGGVINVILRKNYSGSEARVGYENTFDTDTSVRTASFTHGFASGGLSGLVSASFEDGNALMWRDRDFLRTFDRTEFGFFDLRFAGPGGPGAIRAASGNLPGLTVNQRGIPAGSSGVNVPASSYGSTAVPDTFDGGETAYYSTPYARKSVLGNVSHELRPWLSLFAEGRWSESESWYDNPIVASNLTIPAGAPGNPFGVPVILDKQFFDIPVRAQSLTRNTALALGARGEVFADWQYEASFSLVGADPDFDTTGGLLNATRVAEAFASATPPNLLYDSTTGQSPNPRGTLERLTAPAELAERTTTRTYDLGMNGSVFRLPAGAMRVAVGAEFREDDVAFPVQAPTSVNPRGRNRYSAGYFAEVRLPLITQEQGIPLINRLEARAALRHDKFTDFPDADTPSYGLLYRPFSWLMLRGSLSEGYKVPTLSQLYRGRSTVANFPPANSIDFRDPERGNQAIVAPPGGLLVTQGGNPALLPEHSRNRNLGAVFEIPQVPGLSFSADYFESDYFDRAGSLTVTNRILFAPDTVTRGTNLPGDLPGWPGPVIGYENVVVNVASDRMRGFDFSAKFHHETPWGEVTLNGNASQITWREIRSTPNLPPTAGSTVDSLPLQLTGSFFWTRGPWESGVTLTFRDEYSPQAGVIFTGAARRWDWQGSYDFGSSFPWMLADTRIALTVFNVLDKEPPLTLTTFPDNTLVDSRMRRYSLNLTKRF